MLRPMQRVLFDEIITRVTQKSMEWNRNVFGNIFKRKKRLEDRIHGIQRANNYCYSRELQTLERQLTSELNDVLDQEEAFWFQKSRMDWIREGDRNTLFTTIQPSSEETRIVLGSLKFRVPGQMIYLSCLTISLITFRPYFAGAKRMHILTWCMLILPSKSPGIKQKIWPVEPLLRKWKRRSLAWRNLGVMGRMGSQQYFTSIDGTT